MISAFAVLVMLTGKEGCHTRQSKDESFIASIWQGVAPEESGEGDLSALDLLPNLEAGAPLRHADQGEERLCLLTVLVVPAGPLLSTGELDAFSH